LLPSLRQPIQCQSAADRNNKCRVPENQTAFRRRTAASLRAKPAAGDDPGRPEVRNAVKEARARTKLTISKVLITVLRLLEAASAPPEPALPLARELKDSHANKQKRPTKLKAMVRPEEAQGRLVL
jgi:hypothetical protein